MLQSKTLSPKQLSSPNQTNSATNNDLNFLEFLFTKSEIASFNNTSPTIRPIFVKDPPKYTHPYPQWEEPARSIHNPPPAAETYPTNFRNPDFLQAAHAQRRQPMLLNDVNFLDRRQPMLLNDVNFLTAPLLNNNKRGQHEIRMGYESAAATTDFRTGTPSLLPKSGSQFGFSSSFGYHHQHQQQPHQPYFDKVPKKYTKRLPPPPKNDQNSLASPPTKEPNPVLLEDQSPPTNQQPEILDSPAASQQQQQKRRNKKRDKLSVQVMQLPVYKSLGVNIITPIVKTRYICTWPDCGKSFSTTGHVSRHERIHLRLKPHQCLFSGCGLFFSRSDNMKQHYRTHFENKERGSKKKLLVKGKGVRSSSVPMMMINTTDLKGEFGGPFSAGDVGVGGLFSVGEGYGYDKGQVRNGGGIVGVQGTFLEKDQNNDVLFGDGLYSDFFGGGIEKREGRLFSNASQLLTPDPSPSIAAIPLPFQKNRLPNIFEERK